MRATAQLLQIEPADKEHLVLAEEHRVLREESKLNLVLNAHDDHIQFLVGDNVTQLASIITLGSVPGLFTAAGRTCEPRILWLG